jgi:hypothetical protein
MLVVGVVVSQTTTAIMVKAVQLLVVAVLVTRGTLPQRLHQVLMATVVVVEARVQTHSGFTVAVVAEMA